MRDSDVELIVQKLAKRLSLKLDTDAGVEEWQRQLAEEAEKEIRYAEWHRQSHSEHLLKIALRGLLGIILTVGILTAGYFEFRRREAKENDNSEMRMVREREEKQFCSDFEPLLRLTYTRNADLYSKLLASNKELLAYAQLLCEKKQKDKSETRRELEELLIRRINDAIGRCAIAREMAERSRSEDNIADYRVLGIDFDPFDVSCGFCEP